MEVKMNGQNIVITENDGNQPTAESLPIIQPKENELLTLTHAVIEWKKLNSEISELGEQVKERRKKQKALQEIILRIMKSHNIGALDLKSSGGRVMYKKKKGKGGLSEKKLADIMKEFLGSETRATEAMKFIAEHRDVVTKESLAYEKLD
jgi:hypothetical protein